MTDTCEVDECTSRKKARVWCNKHYLRWWKFGDPLGTVERTSTEERFWSKVDRCGHDDCWPWLAAKNAKGYGIFRKDGSPALAHRVAYEFTHGEVPEYDRALTHPLTLDHLCRNRACVNPAHLEPVSSKENTARGSRATATHCLRGHPFDGANTVIYVDAWGRAGRRCRACQGVYWRRQARKAAA